MAEETSSSWSFGSLMNSLSNGVGNIASQVLQYKTAKEQLKSEAVTTAAQVASVQNQAAVAQAQANTAGAGGTKLSGGWIAAIVGGAVVILGGGGLLAFLLLRRGD